MDPHACKLTMHDDPPQDRAGMALVDWRPAGQHILLRALDRQGMWSERGANQSLRLQPCATRRGSDHGVQIYGAQITGKTLFPSRTPLFMVSRHERRSYRNVGLIMDACHHTSSCLLRRRVKLLMWRSNEGGVKKQGRRGVTEIRNILQESTCRGLADQIKSKKQSSTGLSFACHLEC